MIRLNYLRYIVQVRPILRPASLCTTGWTCWCSTACAHSTPSSTRSASGLRHLLLCTYLLGIYMVGSYTQSALEPRRSAMFQRRRRSTTASGVYRPGTVARLGSHFSWIVPVLQLQPTVWLRAPWRIKAVGHQWYWSYEYRYSDFWFTGSRARLSALRRPPACLYQLMSALALSEPFLTPRSICVMKITISFWQRR